MPKSTQKPRSADHHAGSADNLGLLARASARFDGLLARASARFDGLLARTSARFDRPASIRTVPCARGALLLLAGLALAGACGGKPPPATEYAAATPEQERVFEHGVDFVAALEGLEGRWRDDWDRDLQARVSGADFIGTVKVKTLLTETDPEQRVTHRLVASVERSISGKADDKELELRVREGQVGFLTVHENLKRIQSRDFVAYVKWYRDDVGARAAHFHLSPASDVIVGETERTVGLKKAGAEAANERVIVHTN
jgi:hypothetical protein